MEAVGHFGPDRHLEHATALPDFQDFNAQPLAEGILVHHFLNNLGGRKRAHGGKLRSLWAFGDVERLLKAADEDVDQQHQIVALQLRFGQAFAQFLMKEVAHFCKDKGAA